MTVELRCAPTQGFPISPALTPLEAIVYPGLCYGQDDSEIAQDTSLSPSIVKFRVAGIRHKLRLGRMGIALQFLEEHGMSQWLPPEAYRDASLKIALLNHTQYHIVAELAKQWKLYLSGQSNRPTRATIAAGVWYAPQTIAQSLCTIAMILGITSQFEARECKLVRWLEMSSVYQDISACQDT